MDLKSLTWDQAFALHTKLQEWRHMDSSREDLLEELIHEQQRAFQGSFRLTLGPSQALLDDIRGIMEEYEELEDVAFPADELLRDV